MQIDTYICLSDKNNIPKVLQNPISVTGALRSEDDITEPVIDVTSAIPLQCNYCYIADFHRYYFVSMEVIRTGLYRMHCSCDVLQSFYDQFFDSPCILSRNTSVYNSFVPDKNRGFYQYTIPEYLTIGDIGTPNIILMITAG